MLETPQPVFMGNPLLIFVFGTADPKEKRLFHGPLLPVLRRILDVVYAALPCAAPGA